MFGYGGIALSYVSGAGENLPNFCHLLVCEVMDLLELLEEEFVLLGKTHLLLSVQLSGRGSENQNGEQAEKLERPERSNRP